MSEVAEASAAAERAAKEAIERVAAARAAEEALKRAAEAEAAAQHATRDPWALPHRGQGQVHPHKEGLQRAGDPPIHDSSWSQDDWRRAQDEWVSQFTGGKASLPPAGAHGSAASKTRSVTWKQFVKQHMRAKRAALAEAGDEDATSSLESRQRLDCKRQATESHNGLPWIPRPRGQSPIGYRIWDHEKGAWVNSKGEQRPTRDPRQQRYSAAATNNKGCGAVLATDLPTETATAGPSPKRRPLCPEKRRSAQAGAEQSQSDTTEDQRSAPQRSAPQRPAPQLQAPQRPAEAADSAAPPAVLEYGWEEVVVVACEDTGASSTG